MRPTALLPLLSILLLAACSSDPKPPRDFDELPPAEAEAGKRAREQARPRPAQPEAALAHTRGAAQDTGRGLKGRLGAAMAAGGPVAAVTACNTQAPGVGDEVLERTGVRVGRSSLRLRNPRNAEAPDWVRSWLTEQGERPAEGVTGIEGIEDLEGGKVARVLIPIAMEPQCLTCHGAKEGLAPDVAARIAELYPEDQATGYETGALRGALWAEYALPAPAPAGG